MSQSTTAPEQIANTNTVTPRKKTLADIPRHDLHGKRVLVRVDFNVPQNDALEITDDSRMRAALPTINYLTQHGAKVILMSHLGRPKGQHEAKYSLAPIAMHLKSLLPDTMVRFANDVVGDDATALLERLENGEVLLLENTRFEPGEEKNDPALAKQLAAMGDIFVNDAFGAAHRAHASTEGLTHFMPECVAGFLMANEIEALSRVIHSPNRPLMAIIGGSKISSKISVLNQLIHVVDTLVIGGGMMFTFIAAQGGAVGHSLVEPDWIESARELKRQAVQLGKQVIVATDVVAADAFSADAKTQICPANAIPEGWMGLDIGPESRKTIADAIQSAKTILWNGPMGVFELAPFEAGTRAVAEAVEAWTEGGHGESILGGGDTVSAIEQFGFKPEQFTHVSTGGGASLEFLEGRELPGIAALQNAS
ncbi:MAG: phosphoglycerate kinase [Vampirovibrionales bacterium]|nr:phosphoglycerate kinase [Vampirovibrionales bacterium]